MAAKALKTFESKFWIPFAKEYWEKKPFVLRNSSHPIFSLDDADIFKFLLLYSEHCRQTKSAEGLKLYIDGQRADESELWHALPVKKDASLLGYHRRMEKTYEDYCLVCDELSQGAKDKWAVLESFLKPLYESVGVPNRYAEMGLYLGNYRKTPFGVHVDGCGVFSFPVVGTKKFRLWDPKFVEKNLDLQESFSYDDYKKHSTLLEVGPKEMAYWPSTAWHIAESDGSFSATWSIGIWLDKTLSEEILEALTPLITQKIKTYSKLHSVFPSKKKLPEPFFASIKLIKKISQVEIERAFQKKWRQKMSKLGFKSGPIDKAN